ncbi:MAG TPA: hypothetical protein VNL74_04325 [Methylococcus sp.]|nr:hypothetical protein [Methylococcus sp.]
MVQSIGKAILMGAAVLVFAVPSWSEETRTEQPGPAMGPMAGKGPGMMGGGMMSEEQMDQHVRQMQTHMLQMHEIMEKIQDTKDPAEKEKLMQQQRDMIKEHIRSRHHQMMMQQQMQGGGGGMMGHGGPAEAPKKP